mmetsp:Transcript_19526/g.31295  ORF Transcript_19526/g.31295 Transcript_19526/m.31295 type:complete len:107 (-) Transcript_19526:880-1200(-)
MTVACPGVEPAIDNIRAGSENLLIYNTKFSVEDVEALAQEIIEADTLKSFTLVEGSIPDEALEILGEAFGQNQTLESIELECGMSDDGAHAFASGLSQSTTIKSVR